MLVFCDTEKKPHEQYEDIKRKINEFHGVDNAADEVIIFGNPCTMQIISKHWTDENLKSPAKPVNAPLIKEYTGVENYKGRADQIQKVMEHVTAENYKDVSQRVRKLDSDDSVIVFASARSLFALFSATLLMLSAIDCAPCLFARLYISCLFSLSILSPSISLSVFSFIIFICLSCSSSNLKLFSRFPAFSLLSSFFVSLSSSIPAWLSTSVFVFASMFLISTSIFFVSQSRYVCFCFLAFV